MLSSLLAGALAGSIATLPMTAAMQVMHRRLPRQERYPLPPSEIAAQVTEEVGLRKHLDEPRHVAVTLLSHFGYGAAAGAVYAPLANKIPFPPVLEGIAFGLVVWAASYLGWLPAMGILRPATEHPARRNALMVAAHLVWGSVTGVLVDRFERGS